MFQHGDHSSCNSDERLVLDGQRDEFGEELEGKGQFQKYKLVKIKVAKNRFENDTHSECSHDEEIKKAQKAELKSKSSIFPKPTVNNVGAIIDMKESDEEDE